MGLQQLPEFGFPEYMKCLYAILLEEGRKDGNAAILVPKEHRELIPVRWYDELKIERRGMSWMLTRVPSHGEIKAVHYFNEIGRDELLICLWLALKVRNNRFLIRDRMLKRIPDDFLERIEIFDGGVNWWIKLKDTVKIPAGEIILP